jgi:hypothetical protein
MFSSGKFMLSRLMLSGELLINKLPMFNIFFSRITLLLTIGQVLPHLTNNHLRFFQFRQLPINNIFLFLMFFVLPLILLLIRMF